MHFESGPRELPPVMAAGALLTMFAQALGNDGQEVLSAALRVIVSELKSALPQEYERDDDGLKLRPINYDHLEHCKLTDRLLSGMAADIAALNLGANERVSSVMFRRSRDSLIQAVRAEAAGDVGRAWRCIASASMGAGIAMAASRMPDDATASALQNADAIVAAAFSQRGRDAARKSHQPGSGRKAVAIKATVHTRWESWVAFGADRSRMPTKAAFAREMVTVEGATSTEVVERWCRQWEKGAAASAKPAGKVGTKPAE